MALGGQIGRTWICKGPQSAFQLEGTAVSKGMEAGRSSSQDYPTQRAGPAQHTASWGLQRQDPRGRVVILQSLSPGCGLGPPWGRGLGALTPRGGRTFPRRGGLRTGCGAGPGAGAGALVPLQPSLCYSLGRPGSRRLYLSRCRRGAAR